MSAFWLRLFGVLCLLGAGLYLFYLLYWTPSDGPLRSVEGEASGDSRKSPSGSSPDRWISAARSLVRRMEPLIDTGRQLIGQAAPAVVEGIDQARSWVQAVATSNRVDEGALLEKAREASVREGYDAGHAERIADLAVRMGEAVGLDPEVLTHLRWAGWLHDVAPSGIEDALLAPMALSPRDMTRLQRHPLLCQAAVESLLPGSDVAWWVRMAHERSDGMGYPDGAFNEDLPLPARCLAIADTFEALVHDRPYRRALEPQDALLELQQVAGSQLDAGLVKVFAEQVYPGWIR